MQPRLSGQESLEAKVARLEEIVRYRVEFGNPSKPGDPASTTAAGGTAGAHNGTPDNILGTWAEVTFTATDTPTTVYHNLGVIVTNSELNVRWSVWAFQHNGTGVLAGVDTLTVMYETTDSAAVLPNSINLRLYAAGTRTVNGGNPVKVTLFFIPAVRGVL